MTKLIPNENTWVGVADTIANISAPTAAEITAATELTPLLITINAGAQGNTVPTPTLDTLFETSIPGTSAAQFTGDFYRDDDLGADYAWDELPRGKKCYFIISRFGGTGAGRKPIATDIVEVWPVQITSRAMAQMSSNTALMFTITAAVHTEPDEDAVVAA